MPFPSADTAVTLKETVSPALAWKSYCSAVTTGGCVHMLHIALPTSQLWLPIHSERRTEMD